MEIEIRVSISRPENGMTSWGGSLTEEYLSAMSCSNYANMKEMMDAVYESAASEVLHKVGVNIEEAERKRIETKLVGNV